EFFLFSVCPHPVLHSFPTRRSSDLLFPLPSSLFSDPPPRARTSPRCASSSSPKSCPTPSSSRLCPSPLSRSRTSSESAQRLWMRSEDHTSELQSRENLVCRLLLEKT